MNSSDFTTKDIERFWSKVNVSDDPNACWEWTGYILRKYGYLNINGKNIRVHRFSYALHYGSIPNGQVIRHNCDNPSCVNPKHLSSGTQPDNIKDKMLKNRQAQGERHGRSKLTEQEISEIRDIYAKGDVGYRKLAKRFCVSHIQIANIVKGKHWKA